MTVLQLAWLNAALLVIGFALAILGFWLDAPQPARITLQVLALVTLGGVIWTLERLAYRWKQMTEES